MRKLRAFTLNEVIVVLFISGILWALSIGPGKETLASLNEQLFFREMRQLWFATFYHSTKNNTVAIIYIEDDAIIFKDSAEHRITLAYPKTLRHLGGTATYVIEKKGSIRPDTEVFSSTLKKRYTMHVQLGYGMQYRLEEENEK